jgi:hypothetical protein
VRGLAARVAARDPKRSGGQGREHAWSHLQGAKPVHPNPQREKTLAAPGQKKGEEGKSALTMREIRDEIRNQETCLRTMGTPGSNAYQEAQARVISLQGL